MKSMIHKTTNAPNAGSMADIAFLLLIFFMITTTIVSDKGLMIQLPQHTDESTTFHLNERNIFKILVNSKDELMVEGKQREGAQDLRTEIKAFVLNHGKDNTSSDSPKDAVVSIKTARGTSQASFIQVLDEAKAAYYEIYAERAGITTDEYRKLGNSPADLKIIRKASEEIPMNISIAEPD
ncbi:ExbD/TolR family protein [Fulvivirga ligni]|uniref:ExbD/TolR family protein n=1 Tax=Fulvivirga ligni TaxID=2904246 RepID=UPI001F2AD3DF|nr:biopolymer transporter ExbD [Fulvivirga ligni]UII20346.1 biopolymer transporter ExbD [Fulvivirga ligni]